MRTSIAIDDVITDVIETDVANGGEPPTSKLPQTVYWQIQPFPAWILWAFFGVMVLGFLIGFFFWGQVTVPALPVATAVATPTAGAAVTPTPTSTSTPTAGPTPSPTAEPTATPISTSTPPTIAVLESLEPHSLSGMCALVVREPLDEFPLQFDWRLYWYGFAIDEMVITMSGANNDQPVAIPYDEGDEGFRGRFGLNSPGPKEFESVIAVLPDGSLVDLTPFVIAYLGTDTLDVAASGNQGFGLTCPR